MVPVASDVVNIFVKIGAISSAHSLRIYVEISSGPFAFLGSRFFSNFCTPLTSNVSSLMRGAGGVRRHGISVISSFVKILSYCLLSDPPFLYLLLYWNGHQTFHGGWLLAILNI